MSIWVLVLELFVIQFDNTVLFNMHSEYTFPCLCVPFQANARLKTRLAMQRKREDRREETTTRSSEKKGKQKLTVCP
jgi:hypothetical protein